MTRVSLLPVDNGGLVIAKFLGVDENDDDVKHLRNRKEEKIVEVRYGTPLYVFILVSKIYIIAL
jgi:hypothetical protein